MFDELDAQSGPAAKGGGPGYARDDLAAPVGGGAAGEAARTCLLCPRAMTCASFLARSGPAPGRVEPAPAIQARTAGRRCS